MIITLPTGEGSRKFCEEDVPRLLSDIRPTDLRELEIAAKDLGLGGPASLLMSFTKSDKVFALHDSKGDTGGCFGLFEHHPNTLRMAMFTTFLLEEHGFKFLKVARQVFTELTKGYEVVFTYSIPRGENHLKFLKFLGFKLYDTIWTEHGPVMHHIQTL